MSEEVTPEQIHSLDDILKYLDTYKRIRNLIVGENKNLIAKIKPPNMSEDVSESLACKLINEGTILWDKYGQSSKAERFGRSGVDILVNGKFKIECKGTTSLDGFISISKTNMIERDAWIWLDFQDYIREDSQIISVHIIHKPSQCVKPRKIEANGESKMTMKASVMDAWRAGTYQGYELSTPTMSILTSQKQFNDDTQNL